MAEIIVDSRSGANTGIYSRKGGTDTNSNITEFIWEDRVRTLRDIVTSGKYPCVVKVKTGNVERYRSASSARDITCEDQFGDDILHVLELRRHKMVISSKLQWDRRTGEYMKTEMSVDINVSQKGWFEVIPENGQPVEYFDTINAIVGLRPKQFLVRTSIVGYQLSIDNGVSTWVPWEVRPGETLTTGIIHMDQKKTKKKTLFKRLFSSGKGGVKKEQDIKYLQCFDNENREIMIPLITTGVFSPVGDQTNQSFDAVYTLHDLINAFNLPMKVQLIHTDAHGQEGVPTGVLLLERLIDKETVLVGKHPYIESESETFEIPLNDEFHVMKERKRKSKKPSIVNEDNSSNVNEIVQNGHVDLPIRVKDPIKKSKGSGILDKLSVRSKNKKERASIKALADEGIFSSRLSKSGVSFDDFYNADLEPDYDNVKGKASDDKHETETFNNAIEKETVKSKSEIDLENGYSVTMKRGAIQERLLPPIPIKTRSPHKKKGPENDYEELPFAPGPPDFYLSKGDEIDCPDDGYMTPAKFRELNESASESTDFDVIVKRKPPTAPRDSVRYTRARKARSEYSSPPRQYNADEENIQQYFDYALADGNNMSPSENPYDRRKYQNNISPMMRSISQEEGRRFNDDTAIDTRILSGFAKLKSRSHKNLNFESNATVRSHNVRRMRAAQDVFNFNDSLRDLRQPFQNVNEGAMEPTYGRVVDNERIKSYVFGEQNPYDRLGGHHYVESEPALRRYHRSSSNAALSDSYPKHGDDSAISMCSRGEYGVMMPDSEYSYSEYSEWQDDGWIPPDDISNLSVLEVSKSLRYIGMKDRVVIRFAREQIDGNMLCSLDVKLLREGFPELNSLDIKKVLDFVGGWRPKK